MSLRSIYRAQINQAAERLRRARKELEHTETEAALFKPELIEAARNRVIEATHNFSRVQDSFKAVCC